MSVGQGTAKEADALERLNHYQALGLTEGSSSHAVSRGLWVERWPWHLLTEEARNEATRRRILAYGVLNDPHTRVAYDRELGFTRRHIAASVADGHPVWGQVWLVAFAVVAVLMFIAGPYDVARIIGGNFAPDFNEVFVFHTPDDCFTPPCEGYYAREFRSSSDAWEPFLNGWGIWLAPPLVAAGVGLLGRPLVNRVGGWLVACVRFTGYRDTLTRAIMVVLVLALVLAIVGYPVLSAPSAPASPDGAG